MAKISTYVIDGTIVDGDKVIGSDANNDLQTKNYTIGNLVNYFAASIGNNLLVPYVGATNDVDLGTHGLFVGSIDISGTFTSNGSVGLPGEVLMSQGPGLPAVWAYNIGSQDLQNVLLVGNTADRNMNLVNALGSFIVDVQQILGQTAVYLHSPLITNSSVWKVNSLHLDSSTGYSVDYLTDKIRFTNAGNFVDIKAASYSNQSFSFPTNGGFIPMSVNGVYADGSGSIIIPIGLGTVTAVTASLPLSSSGGVTPNLSISQASALGDGYLSSANWNAFNAKQDQITLTTTGTSGAATFIANTLNIPQYSGGQNLQQVTDVGNITTNDIYINALYLYDSASGTLYNRIESGDQLIAFYNGTSGNEIAQFEEGVITSFYNGIGGQLQFGILTSTRGYTMPDASGTLALSVNGNFADATGNITISAGGGTNPTSTFIPYNNAGTFADSYLINDTAISVLKTNYLGTEIGLYLDFTNDFYILGRAIDKIGFSADFVGGVFTIGDILNNGNYFEVNSGLAIYKTVCGGTDKGLYLDFVNNQYYIGDTNYFVKVDTLIPNTTISTLSGTGTRMVVADASGVLSTQVITTGTVTGTGTATQVAFWDTSTSLSSNSNLYWNNTNKYLGVNVASPSYNLDVFGSANILLDNPIGGFPGNKFAVANGMLRMGGDTDPINGWRYIQFTDTADTFEYFSFNSDQSGNPAFSMASAGSFSINSGPANFGLGTKLLTVLNSGTVNIASLATGGAAQMVIADSTGTLGIQTIPTGGGGIPHATASGTDTYTSTITGVTSYADGDAYLIRFTNGNTTVSTLDINSLGPIALYRNNDGALIGGDIEDGGEMLCVYNSTLNRFQLIGTSPNTLLSYVTNADTVAITKGMPVYAFSGVGDRMTVKRAFNTSDATSAQTVGIVLSSSIGVNQKGFIMMQGLLDGLSILPTSTWADGDPVYLGSTAGTITNVKPYAPNHLVYLGIVTTANNGAAGRMYVRVQNGYELDELHNVQAQTPTLKDTLWYDNTVSPAQWKTASISTILGYTPIQRSVNVVSTATAAGSTAATDYVYFVSGTTTVTLPTAVGNTNRYTIKNTGTNVVSIATTSSQTVDGSASPIIINVQNVSLDIISDGANWNII